jgi:carboxypeptidase Taq
MQKQLDALKTHLREIYDLQNAGNLLNWDEATYMPPGGAEARGRQNALIGRLAHEKSVDPALGNLLDELQPYEESLPYNSDEASMIRVARREFERSIKIPPQFMAGLYEHMSKSYNTWVYARPANDFKKLEPLLEQRELSRRLWFFPGYEHIADPLIDIADYGMKATVLRSLFAQLRREMIPLVQAITSQPPPDDSCLKQFYPQADQLEFGLEVIKQLGYDFKRGRQDLTLHPFMTKFSLGDVRITTNVNEYDLSCALYSTVHEAGHGMYEQGFRLELEGTPLADGVSAGIHESQSRTWENLVGRSRNFWEYFYPKIQAKFPEQLGKVSLETFYQAVNKVQRSLIRIDADEVTYNLHVMIRFDIELALLEGNPVRTCRVLARVITLTWAFARRCRDGVMQDVLSVDWWVVHSGALWEYHRFVVLLPALLYPEIQSKWPREPHSPSLACENVYQHGKKIQRMS